MPDLLPVRFAALSLSASSERRLPAGILAQWKAARMAALQELHTHKSYMQTIGTIDWLAATSNRIGSYWCAVNTYKTSDRPSSVTPERPPGVPWKVICLLVATLAFLAGHVFWSVQTQQSNALVTQPPVASRVTAFFGHGSQNPVADVVAVAEPAVVSIETTIKQKDTSELSLPDLLQPKSAHPLLREPEHLEAHGSGSGAIIRQDGYILTNNHVVKDAQDIRVTLNDGRVYTGRVVGRDTYSDIAVVKIDAYGLPEVRLGESKTVRPGDWAIAIGTPLGLNHTVTMGIVSAVGRSLADLNNNVDLIQTDAAINPGNSGGPLLNINGEVIGINMAIRTDAQNIGFTIPIDVAKDAINAIMSNRPILHPYLGLSMVDYDPQLAQAIGLSEKLRGVVVSRVVDGSPAFHSGISTGDLIVSVNDVPVHSGSQVQAIVRQHHVGTRINLHLLHSGKTENVSVMLKAFPQSADDG
jgi:S1-C subfamily serine protease